jgi:hypothetical protein
MPPTIRVLRRHFVARFVYSEQFGSSKEVLERAAYTACLVPKRRYQNNYLYISMIYRLQFLSRARRLT